MKTETELAGLLMREIRDVPDFPKKGIVFKDITPVLSNPPLMKETIKALSERIRQCDADVIVGVEARGFIFGALIASELGLPFVPMRKPGKLPWKTKKIDYALEYGTASIEIHEDALKKGQKIALVDDLLATGGTSEAACKLVSDFGAEVCAIAFVVELAFLGGRKILEKYSPVISIMEVN